MPSASLAISGNLIVADAISIDQTTGAVSLVSPQTVKITLQTSDGSYVERQIAQLIGKYVTGVTSSPFYSESVIFYLSGSANIWRSEGIWCVEFGKSSFYIVGSQIYNIPAGATTYVHSADRNAYPDNGGINGITYEYLGIPFDNAVTAPAIATGSYTGTGTSGSASPNVITFSFVPKLLIMTAKKSKGVNYYSPASSDFGCVCRYDLLTTEYNRAAWSSSGYSCSYGKVSADRKTLYWYYDGGEIEQFNSTGCTYYWIAFG